MTFHDLHQQPAPLLIGNVWDVPSATVAEQLGSQAIGTSSAAMANMLGFPDGEKMDFAHLLLLTERILAHVNIPLSVDLEAGYSRDPDMIARHINQLHGLGVVGVNLEDSVVTDQRRIQEAEVFADIIASVREKISPAFFLNIRTDTYFLDVPGKLAQTQRRGQLYADAGADGLFVPKMVSEEDISEIVASVALPLNVMCFPGLPTFEKHGQMGVQRISMGNFLHASQSSDLSERLALILADQSFQSVC